MLLGVTMTTEWQAIKEAVVLIDSNPSNLSLQKEQFRIIEKYAAELKGRVNYAIGQTNKISCCG